MLLSRLHIIYPFAQPGSQWPLLCTRQRSSTAAKCLHLAPSSPSSSIQFSKTHSDLHQGSDGRIWPCGAGSVKLVKVPVTQFAFLVPHLLLSIQYMAQGYFKKIFHCHNYSPEMGMHFAFGSQCHFPCLEKLALVSWFWTAKIPHRFSLLPFSSAPAFEPSQPEPVLDEPSQAPPQHQ